jgi:hypothetical protein
MDQVKPSGRSFAHTIGSLPLAFIIYLLSFLIVGGVVGVFNFLMTVMRPGVIGFISVVTGSVAGISLAKAACDAWLPRYRPRAVFVMFAILFAIGLVMEIFFVPFDTSRINSYVQVVVTVAAAFGIFWNDETFH